MAGRVHFKTQDGIVTHRLYINNYISTTIYLPSFPDPPATSPCLLVFNSLSSSYIVGEDIISDICGNDLGVSYHVIGHAQFMIVNADKSMLLNLKW